MHIPPYFIEELKQRVRISDVIGARLKLHKKGREYLAICPFHNDSKPSLTIVDDKGFYHCFACGAHGNALDFLQEYEALSFVDAVKRLADMASMPIPSVSYEDKQKLVKSKELIEVASLVCQYFENQLADPAGKVARKVIKDRDISSDMVKKFRLGYAPDIPSQLSARLKGFGVKEEQLVQIGILKKRDDGSYYNFFRNRLIFPIMDRNGNPVAFGGRIIEGDGAKYLNTSDSPIFHKGKMLYGYNYVNEAMRQKQSLIVAEGYMDVIALHQAGFIGAVAPLGTAVTESQLSLLWRQSSSPIFSFDGDEAGKKAAIRACMRALPIIKSGNSIKFCFMPNGEDPDSFLKKYGVEKYKVSLAAAKEISDLIWLEIVENNNINSAEDAARAENELKKVILQVKDDVLQKYYYSALQKKIWQKLGLNPPESSSIVDIKPSYRKSSRKYDKQEQSVMLENHLAKSYKTNTKTLAQEQLVIALFLHPALFSEFSDVDDKIMSINCADRQLEIFRKELVKFLLNNVGVDFKDVYDHFCNMGKEYYINSLLTKIKHHDGYRLFPLFKKDTPINTAYESWIDIWKLTQNVNMVDEVKNDSSMDFEEKIKQIRALKAKK